MIRCLSIKMPTWVIVVFFALFALFALFSLFAWLVCGLQKKAKSPAWASSNQFTSVPCVACSEALRSRCLPKSERTTCVKPEQSIANFRGELTSRYEVAPGPCMLAGAVFTIDAASRRCTGVERVMLRD